MPKNTLNAQEQETASGIAEAVKQSMGSIAVTTSPVVICGVNRKANLGEGSYENLDVYSGVAIPLNGVSVEDMDELQEAITKASEFGFYITSKETYERYNAIKEAQEEKRK